MTLMVDHVMNCWLSAAVQSQTNCGHNKVSLWAPTYILGDLIVVVGDTEMLKNPFGKACMVNTEQKK